MATLAPMTELKAVNIVLRNMGEAPVNTLTGTLPPEASVAQQAIAEASRALQTRGWYFNREKRQLTPDANTNKIGLPANTLSVRSADEDRNTKVSDRGGFLYDMTPYEQTFEWDKAMKVELVLGLSFEDLPESARRFIAYSTARAVQVREEGDELSYKEDQNDEARAWADLMAEQLAAEPLKLSSATIDDVTNLQYRGGY